MMNQAAPIGIHGSLYCSNIYDLLIENKKFIKEGKETDNKPIWMLIYCSYVH